MLIESAQPGALAGRQRSGCARRSRALDFVVVIDVALTETARCADYVLPAASQFEKWEATFFTLEFPRERVPAAARRSSSRCRARCPRPRSTRASCGRSARTPTTTSRRCTRPRPRGRAAFADAFLDRDGRAAAARAARADRALRDARPDAAATGREGAAAVWGLAQTCFLLSLRVGAACRLRRRRRAVRRDARQPVGRDVHGRRLRRDAGRGSTLRTARSTS